MEQYEPFEQADDTEAVLRAHDESYNPLLRPRHLDPMFEGIRMEQMKAAELQFATPRDAMEYVVGVLGQFGRECVEKGLMSQPVFLMGEGIMMPHQDVDPFSGRTQTYGVPIEQENGDIALIAGQSGIDGVFMGLGYKMERINDTSEDDTACRVQFLYQVCVGENSTLFAYTSLAATGDVLTTDLEFAKDRRNRELAEIKQQLLVVESDVTKGLIHSLITILATYGDYTPQTLKTITNLVEQITSSADFLGDTAKHDAIERLLMHFINLNETYTLAVPDALRKIPGGYDSVVKSVEEPLCFEQKLSRVILGPQYRKRGDKLSRSRSRSVPYLVAEADGAVYYLPLGRMTGFYAK